MVKIIKIKQIDWKSFKTSEVVSRKTYSLPLKEQLKRPGKKKESR